MVVLVVVVIGGDFGFVWSVSREKKYNKQKQKQKEYLFKNKEKMKNFMQFNFEN